MNHNMSSLKVICGCLLMLLFSTVSAKKPQYPYQNPKLSIEQRIADLLSRMTLEEKASQMDMYEALEFTEGGNLHIKNADKTLKTALAPGSIHDFYPRSAKEANEVQRYVIENTRLGIPLLFIEEALHGYQGVKATAFPIPLGLASTWNTQLLNQIGHVVGKETRSVGVHFVLGPVLGLGREPRWGRIQETYGEDPYLAAKMGVAAITGMQGDDLTADDAIVSEPKHYGVHSIPEGGKNTAPVYIGRRQARSTFLVPFRKAFEEAGALGTMAAYHEWDGVPAAADPFLLKQLLRDEWGFKGFVLSDLGAVRRLHDTHHTAATKEEAVWQAVENGLDMQFYDYPHSLYQGAIVNGVRDGKLSLEAVDRAVAGILYVKFRLGLFENPYTDESLMAKRYHNEAHQALALQSAEESITLLQNEKNVLPINNKKAKFAVIGRMANNVMLGGYSPKQVEGVSLLQAMNDAGCNVDFVDVNLPSNGYAPFDTQLCRVDGQQGVKVEYFNNLDCEGKPAVTRIEKEFNHYWHNLSPVGGVRKDNFSVRMTTTLHPIITGTYNLDMFADDMCALYIDGKLIIDNWDKSKKNKHGRTSVQFQKGKTYQIELRFADYEQYAGVFLNWNIKPEGGALDLYTDAVQAAKKADYAVIMLGETEEETGEGKDKMSLELSNYAHDLIKSVHATGTPVILLLQNGRPMILTDILKNTDAILETWYAGEKSGEAIYKILTGQVNPSGRLPVTFPRCDGQVPIYYYQQKSATHPYVDGSNKPLFPFGYGLSYSQFTYSDLKLSSESISTKESLEVTLTITNDSDVAGTAVPQLYITDEVSSIATPKSLLKGFQRVELAPHASKTVTFCINPEDLQLWNAAMKEVVEPGTFTVQVGESAADIKLIGHFECK